MMNWAVLSLKRRNPAQLATWFSLLVSAGLTAVLLVSLIGYRDTRLGQYFLGGLFFILIATIIFLRPQWGTYILTITIFTGLSNSFTRQGLPSLNKPLVAITFLSLILTTFVNQRSFPRFKRIELFMLACGMAWFVSAFFAHDRTASFTQITDFIKDFVIVLCIILSLQNRRHWRRALWSLILAAAFVSALSAYQIISGDYAQTFAGLARNNLDQVIVEEYQIRLAGPVGDPNYFGLILVAPFTLAIYRIFDERKTYVKMVAAVSAGFMLFAILNTYSRGAFVTIVVILLMIAIERRVRPSFILLTIFVSLIFTPILPEAYQDRLSSLVDLVSKDEKTVRSESSFKGRYSELIAGAYMFSEYPFMGVGVANYPVRYQEFASRLGMEYRVSERDAHSLYVEIAAETGLFGIFAFGGLFFITIYELARAKRKLGQTRADAKMRVWLTSLQLGFIAFLIGSIFLHDAYIRYLWLLVGFCAAGVHVVDNFVAKGSSVVVPTGDQSNHFIKQAN